MLSSEIADLVNLRHDNVKRTIATLAGKQVIQLPQIEDVKNNQGQTVLEYKICKRDSFIIVAQLSPEFTAKLVDRWQELEAKQQFNIPATLSGALRLAAEQAETIEAQQLLIEQQKPAVAFLDKYVEAKSSKCLSDVAKILRFKPQAFIKMLSDDGVIFQRQGNWIPFQNHIGKGRFTVHTGESNGHAYHQTRVEPAGIVWLATKYGQQ